MAEKPAWMVKLRDRNIGRRATAVDRWGAANLQAYEELVVVDGAPAAVESESGPDWRVRWLMFPYIAGSLLVPQPVRLFYLLGVWGFVAASLLTIRRYFYAVTDRRVLVQRVTPWKARPMGSIASYPRRDVRVVRLKPAKGRMPSTVLTISIAEPSGADKKATLAVNEVVFPCRAEAVRRALENGRPG